AQARAEESSVTVLAADLLPHPLVVFRVTDRVTTQGRSVRAIILGIEMDRSGEQAPHVVKDADLLERLNTISQRPGVRRARPSAQSGSLVDIKAAVAAAQRLVDERLESLNLEFAVPTADLLAVLWPVSTRQGGDTGGEEVEAEYAT